MPPVSQIRFDQNVETGFGLVPQTALAGGSMGFVKTGVCDAHLDLTAVVYKVTKAARGS